MTIQVLAPDVVEKIAAGEVLERPANLVKELVENSLDAGATEIEVEFDQGGRRVQVTDNGAGMPAEELPLSLRRHATSKISTEDDLWKLASYGFRGEALASVAAVSRLTLRSRTGRSAKAGRLVSQFGSLSDVEMIGGPQGTTILVEELFENVPARLKFLKSESAEGAQVKKVLKALALSRPDVTFRIKSKGQLAAFWPAKKTLLERAEQVLEAKPLYASAEDLGIRVEIAFSGPTEVNRTTQEIWVFVQGRSVQDRTVQAAVMDAYRSLLMHGEYPTAVVKIEIDPADVDVNVHPTKAQVKFRESSAVFRAVQGTLRRALEKAPWRPVLRDEPAFATAETAEASQTALALGGAGDVTMYRQKPVNNYVESNSSLSQVSEASEAYVNSAPQVKKFWSNLQVLGQAHQTYILAQSPQALFLVDQHAAHERILFERLVWGVRERKLEVQDFLMPLTISMSAEKIEGLLTMREELQSLGLDVDQAGPEQLAIRSGPALLKERALEKAVFQMADEILSRGGSFALEKVLGDVCATMACHSAIRAGDALSVEDMRGVLELMDEHPLSGHCPHGRPVYIEYPFQQIERSFGRIV